LQVPAFTEAPAALNVMFSPVAYLAHDEVQAELVKVIQNVRNSADFLKTIDLQTIVAWVRNMLVAGVACLKHQGFSEEREWRVIYSPNRSGSPLIESSTETIGGNPQIVRKLPFDRAKSVVLKDLEPTPHL
jgi:hypothetical protein